MKVKLVDEILFDRLFDLNVKFLLQHLNDYKNTVLKLTKESDNKVVIPDKEFMIELSEDAFVRALYQYYKLESERVTERRLMEDSIMDQVNDILDECDDD